MLSAMAGATYIMGFGLWLATRPLVDLTMRWAAKIGGQGQRNRRALPYLMRDLIRLHQPASAEDEKARPEEPVLLDGEVHEMEGKALRLAA